MTLSSTDQVATPTLPVLVVIGVGLIGGSFAQALRKAGICQKVIGVGRSKASLLRAKQQDLIDEFYTLDQLEQAVAHANLVFIATPISSCHDIFLALKDHLPADALIMDACSTKQEIIEDARSALGSAIAQFIPAHPIAGSDASGPEAADADLYQGRQVILTPLPENQKAQLDWVSALWVACGAKLSHMTPAMHDEIFAKVSHLPHFLAAAFMQYVINQNDDNSMAMAGTGFKDFTRIAGGSAEVWRDIFMSNKPMLLQHLSMFVKELEQLKDYLEQSDEQAMYEWLQKTSEQRRQWGAM